MSISDLINHRPKRLIHQTIKYNLIHVSLWDFTRTYLTSAPLSLRKSLVCRDSQLKDAVQFLLHPNSYYKTHLQEPTLLDIHAIMQYNKVSILLRSNNTWYSEGVCRPFGCHFFINSSAKTTKGIKRHYMSWFCLMTPLSLSSVSWCPDTHINISTKDDPIVTYNDVKLHWSLWPMKLMLGHLKKWQPNGL